MCQTRGLHDVGDADAVETLLAEEFACHCKDLLAILGEFFPAHSHQKLHQSINKSVLTIYMTNIINTKQI